MKLLAIDMDGTCLNPKHIITDPTLHWLRIASEYGYEIVPTTGRALSCIPHQLRNSSLYRYVITSNGARVYDTSSETSLYSSLIPKECGIAIIKRCTMQGIGITVHVENDYVIQGRWLATIGRLQYGEDAKESITVKNAVSYLEQRSHDIEEIQLFFFKRGAREKVERILADIPGIQVDFTDKYAEIYAANTSKGAAVAFLADSIEVAKRDIICIGDSTNDIPMFQTAGLRFAMGNAIPKLKAMADVVLPTNADDGVATAIEEYLVNQEIDRKSSMSL